MSHFRVTVACKHPSDLETEMTYARLVNTYLISLDVHI